MSKFFILTSFSIFLFNSFSANTIKKMKIQIETYNDATTSSYTPLSDEFHAKGQYGGSRKLHKKTEMLSYELTKEQIKELLASKLIFQSSYKKRKEDITFEYYLSNRPKSDTYNSQVNEYLSNSPEDRSNFSKWLEPQKTPPKTTTVIKLNGEITYIDNLFYNSEFIDRLLKKPSPKKIILDEVDLVEHLLAKKDFSSLLPSIKNEKILEITHYSGSILQSTINIYRFGKITYKKRYGGKYMSSKFGEAKNSEIESVLNEIKKVNLDPKYKIETFSRYTLEEENVLISFIEEGKSVSYLIKKSDISYSNNIAKLEAFAIDKFNYIIND